jgi:hypothetical protein
LRHTSLDWSILFDGIGVARSELASGSEFNDVGWPRRGANALLASVSTSARWSAGGQYLVCRKDCLENPAVQAFVQSLRVEAQQWDAQQLRKFTAQTAEGAANTLI